MSSDIKAEIEQRIRNIVGENCYDDTELEHIFMLGMFYATVFINDNSSVVDPVDLASILKMSVANVGAELGIQFKVQV